MILWNWKLRFIPKEIIKNAGVEAGMELTEEELDKSSGGWSWPWK